MNAEKIRVLIVDDEPVVCTSCQRFLSEEGYEAVVSQKGEEALAILKEKEIDIVITDLKMPRISGMELLEHVREKYPDVQVIIITGYSTISSAVESMKKGAFDYVPKPFTPDELLSVVKEASVRRMQMKEKQLYRPQKGSRGYDNIIGTSGKMLKIYDSIEKVAPTDATVLITGESGTGKELIARAIHNHSLRKDKQFIAVDCSALVETLLESELFGHVKGSFTGAASEKRGIFEIADGGTLLLDEVSNIPMNAQNKLLRVLEAQEYRPVGGEKEKKVDIRLIAATNRDLKMMIEMGKFREDLYYRLNVFSIDAPPLRERRDDIPMLAEHYLQSVCETLGKKIKGFSREALGIMVGYDWPGNVRELKNVVERLAIITEGDTLSSEALPDVIDKQRTDGSIAVPMTNEELKEAKREAREKSIRDIERNFIIKALERNGWNITKAAESTGMQRTNFQVLIKKYNIKSEKFTGHPDEQNFE